MAIKRPSNDHRECGCVVVSTQYAKTMIPRTLSTVHQKISRAKFEIDGYRAPLRPDPHVVVETIRQLDHGKQEEEEILF